MNSEDTKPPSTDELEAMAYVDGELGHDAALQFETRMASNRGLAQEVSELRALEVVARQMAPAEPMDHEWNRLQRDPLQRAGTGLGFGLILVGTTGLGLWISWAIATSTETSTTFKCLLLGTVAGLALTFLTVLRGRLRTLPLDPYKHIKR